MPDILAKDKQTGKVQRMNEQVFAMNGGTQNYTVEDYEGSATFDKRTEQVIKEEVHGNFAERMEQLQQQAGVIVATSTVVAQPGKLEAARDAIVNSFATLGSTEVGTTEVSPVQPGAKAVSLADLQGLTIGSTMAPHDGTPESTAAAKTQEPFNPDQPSDNSQKNTLNIDDNGTITITDNTAGQTNGQTETGNGEQTGSGQTTGEASKEGESGAEKKSPNQ